MARAVEKTLKFCLQVAKLLLKQDRSVVDIVDSDGRSCLHWSAKTETSKCLEVLLKVASEALVNCQDHEQARVVIPYSAPFN